MVGSRVGVEMGVGSGLAIAVGVLVRSGMVTEVTGRRSTSGVGVVAGVSVGRMMIEGWV